MSLTGAINAVYVRSQDLRRICEAYAEGCPAVNLTKWFKRYVGAEFMAVKVDASWADEPFDLAMDSREFGEAIGLRLKTRDNEDSVVYEHWKDGKWVRRLTFTPELGWDCVQGEPEAWEGKVFGAPPSQGARLPALQGDALFMALLSHFRLPGVWPT
ncbi:MAG: hypothetical protein NTY77_06120 [Elusimicrobia bacterium]|nr:hypothetical protein [Elusimicrobiota bacterium]